MKPNISKRVLRLASPISDIFFYIKFYFTPRHVFRVLLCYYVHLTWLLEHQMKKFEKKISNNQRSTKTENDEKTIPPFFCKSFVSLDLNRTKWLEMNVERDLFSILYLKSIKALNGRIEELSTGIEELKLSKYNLHFYDGKWVGCFIFSLRGITENNLPLPSLYYYFLFWIIRLYL